MAINEQKRLFIGNLPPDIQEHDVKTEFSHYGVVDKVEVKQKKAPTSDEVQNTFAFVTIRIDDRSLRQCLQEFKEQQYRGRYLQVTVARENFLEKLKREREEAAQHKQIKDESITNEVEPSTVRAVLPTISTGKSDESDSSSDDSSEDECQQENQTFRKPNESKQFEAASISSDSYDSKPENNEDNLILKKKSKIFLEKGKIKIDRSVSSGEAIHIIETKTQKVIKKELDEKSQKADQKRLESLTKMKNSYNEQKLAIKKALAGVDASKKSNKIVFGDDDDDDDDGKPSSNNNKAIETGSNSMSREKKPVLFDNDDDSDGEQDFKANFEIKQQFEGKKGEQLRRLQDRFQGDSRFKIDSRFLEEDSDDDNEKLSKNQNDHEKTAHDIETNENDERQWQLNILESVIGKKVHSTASKDTHKKAPPAMLRFDPTRADHTKFVEPKVKKRKAKVVNELDTKRQKIDSEYEQNMEIESNEVPVSMEHFYEVRGDLKKSLGSGGFSLLTMFNRPADNSNTTLTADKPYEEKLLSKTGVKILADFDPFKCDSSGDEADDGKQKINIQMDESDKNKANLKHESFFTFITTDERFSEGLLLFKAPEGIDGTNANEYDDAQRQELKNIVKRKIKKSIQNALPRNAKPNKRFKKFAKNL